MIFKQNKKPAPGGIEHAALRTGPGSTMIGAILLVLATALYASIGAKAQVVTADVIGNVTDPSGAAIPGANIAIESLDTHQKRSTISGSDGAYALTALQPGNYKLTVTENGFKTYSANNIAVAGGDRARVDAFLQIGDSTEQITVSADISAMQTASTNVGTTIVGQSMQDLPINGRNYMAMVQVAAGVNAGSPNALAAGSRLDDRRPTSAISANGQPEFANNQLVDGLDNSSRWNSTVELRPPVEAIQEVRTDVNTYNAEVGHTTGASVNILTKSGSDQFHGSAFEFFRNDITDARNFFASPSTLPHKPELRQNQFGGSIGGPIKKDKTFFFGDPTKRNLGQQIAVRFRSDNQPLIVPSRRQTPGFDFVPGRPTQELPGLRDRQD